MNKTVAIAVGAVALLLVMAAGVYAWQQNNNEEPDTSQSENSGTNGAAGIDPAFDEPPVSASYTSPSGTTVMITSPTMDDKVSSPLVISGSVPGSWSSEGTFTVRLVSLKGDALAEESVTLEGDWMTEELVPFTTSLSFTAPSEESGTVVLVKANPSGLPGNSDSINIPVRF